MSIKAAKQVDEIKERVRWAIGYICDHSDMTNEKIAKDMGYATSTINSYRRKITVPGMDFSAYMKKFNFSPDWLDSGQGEPFPGAHKKYPEVCGSIISITVREEMADYGQNTSHLLFSSDQKINIEEAMGKTYKILSAGSALSVALYMNIQQFAAALDTGHALSLCQDQMKEMQAQIDALNRKVDGLTSRPITAEGQGDGSDKEAM